MQIRIQLLLPLFSALALTSVAHAHVGIATTKGPGTATQGATEEVTFTVGHGCANSTLDTKRVEVSIPAGVTGVRPLHGGVFGEPTVERDPANPATITKVIWTKTTPLLPADSSFYKLTLRAKMPGTPWAKLAFRTYQVCKDAVPASGSSPAEPAEVNDWGSSIEEPAPVLLVFPTRYPGWNKYTIPHMEAADIPLFFKDAEILWLGMAAFSANPAIADLIAAEPGVGVLEGTLLHEAEVWVKY